MVVVMWKLSMTIAAVGQRDIAPSKDFSSGNIGDKIP